MFLFCVFIFSLFFYFLFIVYLVYDFIINIYIYIVTMAVSLTVYEIFNVKNGMTLKLGVYGSFKVKVIENGANR